MNIGTMAIEDLRVLRKKVEDLCMSSDYPQGTVDVDELWSLFRQIEAELKQREVNSNNTVIGNCYAFWTYNNRVVCKIDELYQDKVICSGIIYTDFTDYESESIKVHKHTIFDWDHVNFDLSISEDKRLHVYFHDDEGGQLFARQITPKVYEDFMKCPLDQLRDRMKEVCKGIDNF